MANPEQGFGSALAQSQLATTDGSRSFDDVQSSPSSREASPARTETDSNITYDDGAQDDGEDMGGTSAGVGDVALWKILISSHLSRSQQDPEQSGPTTPAPAPWNRRKRATPSTGREERPAPKHRRRRIETEGKSSPLPQRRYRNLRRDLISTPRQPVHRWNTDP